jgi:hypothetical protein
MTKLELAVARRLLEDQDPWAGVLGVGSRKVSGALGRLQRKGLANYGYLSPESQDIGWRLTPTGRDEVTAATTPRDGVD